MALVETHGLLSVTMTRIADETGIGRATLYKYFPDVEAILAAWHERQITGHLEELERARREAAGPREQLEAVLGSLAGILHESHGHRHGELAGFLHRDPRLAEARARLHAMIGDLIEAAARTGAVRSDVAPEELATYCLNALTAATELRSRTAVRRLVGLTLDALGPTA